MPSIVREVKIYVPCPSFAACQKSHQFFPEIAALMAKLGEGIVPDFAGRGLAHLHDAWRLWRTMRELLARGKNTIDPEVIDPGGRSFEDSPVKSDFTFTFYCHLSMSPCFDREDHHQAIITHFSK
jgi:hypothetical protein